MSIRAMHSWLAAGLIVVVGCGGAAGQSGSNQSAPTAPASRRPAPSKETGEYRDLAAELFDAAGAVRPAKLDRMLQLLGVADASRAAVLKLNPRNDRAWFIDNEAKLAAARKAAPADHCSERVLFAADEPDAATRLNSLFAVALANGATVNRLDLARALGDLRNRARTYEEFIAAYVASVAAAARYANELEANPDAWMLLANTGTPALFVMAQRAANANRALQAEDNLAWQREFDRRDEINRLEQQRAQIDVFQPNGRFSPSGAFAGDALTRKIEDLAGQPMRAPVIGSTPSSLASSSARAQLGLAERIATERAQAVLSQTARLSDLFASDQPIQAALWQRRAAYTKSRTAGELSPSQSLACLKLTAASLEFDGLYSPHFLPADLAVFAEAVSRFSAKDAAHFAAATLAMAKATPEFMAFNEQILSATTIALQRSLWIFCEVGDPAKAVQECDEVMKTFVRLGVSKDKWEGDFLSTKTYALARAGKYADAATAAAQAIDAYPKGAAPGDDVASSTARYRLVSSLCKAGRAKEALAAAEAYRAAAVATKDPMMRERSTAALGRATAACGKAAEGYAMLDRFLDNLNRRGEGKDLRLATVYATAMELAELSGDIPAAIRHAETVIAIRAAGQAPDHPWLAIHRADLARLQKRRTQTR